MSASKDSLQTRYEKAEEDLRAVQRQIYELEEQYLSTFEFITRFI